MMNTIALCVLVRWGVSEKYAIVEPRASSFSLSAPLAYIICLKIRNISKNPDIVEKPAERLRLASG